ncbi:MAG: hypothetical protein OHK0038_05230 [Flammeovirgaceae bacterium]
MRRHILFLLFFVYTLTSKAQISLSDYNSTGRGGVATTFAADYQAIGINPANLGFRKSFRDPIATIGFLETNIGFTTDAIGRDDLFKTLFKSNKQKFTYKEKYEAAIKLADKDVASNADIMLMGFSFRLSPKTSVAFSIRDRAQIYAKLNRTISEIIFMGAGAGYFRYLYLNNNSEPILNPLSPENGGSPSLTEEEFQRIYTGQYGQIFTDGQSYGEILNGSRISSSWYREYNISLGRQIFKSYNLDLFLGGGIKYIQGFWLQDLKAENNTLTVSYISTSPTFGLDFGDSTQITNPSFKGGNRKKGFGRLFPESVGRGLGFDVGFTAIIRDNFHLGLSVTNLGKIKWDGNVYSISDGVLAQFKQLGFNSYNILTNPKGQFSFAGTDSPFSNDYKGEESRIVELPSTIRIGGSYSFFRTVQVGFDFVFPRNDVAGNLERPLYAFGGDFKPSKVFRISTGFNFGGNNKSKVNLPAGITYMARRGAWEFGVATGDIVTLLLDAGESSTVNVAGGFMRFKLYGYQSSSFID